MTIPRSAYTSTEKVACFSRTSVTWAWADRRGVNVSNKQPKKQHRPTPIAKREMRKIRKVLGLPLKGPF